VNVENQRHDSSSLLSWMRQLIAVRQRHAVLTAGDITFLEPDNHRVLAYLRHMEGEDHILVVANLSQRAQSVELDLRRFLGSTPVEVFGGTAFASVGEWPYYLTLTPYSFYWLQLTPKRKATDDAGPAFKPPQLEGSWPAVIEGRSPALVPALRRWIQQRRWYAGKSRQIAKLKVEPARLPGAGTDSRLRLCTISIDYVDGETDSYLVPLTVLDGDRARVLCTFRPDGVVALLPDGRPIVDALQDEASVLELVRPMTVRRGSRPFASESVPALRSALEGDEHTVRILSVEQSNSSVVIDDEVMVKILRRLQNGENLELEVTRHLREVGYRNGAPLLGSLSWRRPDGPDTLALAYGFCPNEGDAWVHVLDQLDLYFQQVPDLEGEATVLGGAAEEIRLLGQRTAELHLALAAGEDPVFRAEPATALYQRSLYSSLRGQLRTTLALLRRQLRALPAAMTPLAEQVLDSREGLLARIDALRSTPIDGMRIQTHGDYHLGQVLFTGRDFVIIDFEGEPGRPLGERRIKRPPLRDVAGMLRSYDYAAHAALAARQERGLISAGEEDITRDHAVRWRDEASAMFLGGYVATDGIDELLPSEPEGRDALLHAFVLEKALYELRYELDNRPSWVPLPLAALAALAELSE
jgi:maltose alpha-D-glucosyltransferase/alpha-amylase